ncbi:MAG: trypsin-like peptidase domain-containing protein [Gemmatimonadaceae bacterium]|nr:trypsin-like peptidase domain-containing protein [Gemmatimonadaceae bacterium]
MMTRAKVVGAVTAAFVGGLAIATAFELPQQSFAQTSSGSTIRTPSGPRDDGGAPGFADVAERVTPAVVSIQVEKDAPRRPQARRPSNVPPGMEEFFNQFQGRAPREPMEGSGTGFLISNTGYILTNNHVVADADRIKVVLTDHREFSAKLIGKDPTTDVAVIKIDGSGFPTVPFGDDNAARIGSWVLAIGNPLGLDFTVTAGIISAKGRGGPTLSRPLRNNYAITDFIQTDAAINPGNSGGPLVNARGEVIGINSMIASETGYYSGYGFAIPISLAKNVSDDLIAHGRVRRAVLGIQIKEVTAEEAKAAQLPTIAGVTVGDFAPSEDNVPSPAKAAGLEPGDVITAIDGMTVDRVGALQRVVRMKKPGDVVSVDVMRFGDKKSFRVRLAEAPSEPIVKAVSNETDAAPEANVGVSADKLGITVEPISEAFSREARVPATVKGVRVSQIDVTSGARGKLFDSDIITEVVYPRPRRAVRTTSELQAALSSLKTGDVITLGVYNVQQQANRVETIRIGGR